VLAANPFGMHPDEQAALFDHFGPADLSGDTFMAMLDDVVAAHGESPACDRSPSDFLRQWVHDDTF